MHDFAVLKREDDVALVFDHGVIVGCDNHEPRFAHQFGIQNGPRNERR